jgi:hypothetical protein
MFFPVKSLKFIPRALGAAGRFTVQMARQGEGDEVTDDLKLKSTHRQPFAAVCQEFLACMDALLQVKNFVDESC